MQNWSISLAICDDDTAFSSVLKAKIEAYFAQGKSCRVDCYATGEELLTAHIEKAKRYDLIFLDVEMPIMNGMVAGRRIREIDRLVQIVVLTNYPQYALEGYSLRPTHYIVKPIQQDQLTALLDELVQRRETDWKHYFNIVLAGRFIRIPYEDILYLESRRNKVFIHTRFGDESLYLKLSDVLAMLDGRFVQTHKSYAVNLDYLSEVEAGYTEVGLLATDVKVPISKRMKTAFIKKLKDYVAYYGGHT